VTEPQALGHDAPQQQLLQPGNLQQQWQHLRQQQHLQQHWVLLHPLHQQLWL
jgi:hypothetical protein